MYTLYLRLVVKISPSPPSFSAFFFPFVGDRSALVVINEVQKYWENMPTGRNDDSITNIFPWLAFWTLLPLALQLCLMSGEIIQMSPQHSIVPWAPAIMSRLLPPVRQWGQDTTLPHPATGVQNNSADTRLPSRLGGKRPQITWPSKRPSEVASGKIALLQVTGLSVCHHLSGMESVCI